MEKENESRMVDSLDSPLRQTKEVQQMMAKIGGLQRELESLRRNSVVESSNLSMEKSLISDYHHSGT